jgi:hypothetical protein
MMKKLTSSIFIFFICICCFGQTKTEFEKAKDSLVHNYSPLLTDKNSYIFFAYNNAFVIISGKKAFYFNEKNSVLIDSLVNEEVVSNFLKNKLENTKAARDLINEVDDSSYNALGHLFYFEKIKGKDVFNFYKPISMFWGLPQYGKFAQSLYGLAAYFYARNLKTP